MKTVKLLATLAILAGGAANAVTVSLNTATGTSAVNLVPPGGSVAAGSVVAGTNYASLTFSSGGANVTATSYFWQQGTSPANTWQRGAVNFRDTAGTFTNLASYLNNGTGVGATGPQNTSAATDYIGKEFILLDFGGGLTQVDTLSLFLLDITVPRYFTYAWLNTAPVNGDTGPTPVSSSGALTAPFVFWDTSAPANYPTPTQGAFSSPGVYDFNFSTYGNGRYLMLGTNDVVVGGLQSVFRVDSVTFVGVPDGGATLALLGAAIGAMGLATRRRRS